MSDSTNNLERILEIVKEKNFNVQETQLTADETLPQVKTSSYIPEKREVKSVNASEDTKTDYEFVRENLHNIIDKGTKALDLIISIADQSEKAFAFDTVATVLKTLVDTNKELVNLHKTMSNIESGGEKKSPGTTNIEKAVFVGSTAELNDLIKKKKEDEMF